VRLFQKFAHPQYKLFRESVFMYVTAIHHIHDPAGFQKVEAEALKKGLPPEFKLPIR
jgi:hypothetical protein